jgi:hypothetical protein
MGLLFWLTTLFFSFGLSVSRNATVIATYLLLLCRFLGRLY